PISLKGEASKMSKEVEEFAKIFKTKTKIPIKFIDERLSSKMAERHLKDTMQMNRKKRSKIIDPIAATLLLQNFINSF
nr:putative pre-16S rRNA nuclease [Candidatus Anoxychlamydiales bacterium]